MKNKCITLEDRVTLRWKTFKFKLIITMKLEEMNLLVRVAQARSMTLAAKQLHLTPAAVSAAVRRIEEVLGTKLFERTTRHLRPTDEGLIVLESCQDMLARWQDTLEDIQDRGREITGTVHLSAPVDTTYNLLVPVVQQLTHSHPNLRLVLHSSDVIHHLQREAIDMAIRYGKLQDSTTLARRLGTFPGVLVASPSYISRHGAPHTPEQLARHRCLTLQRASVPVTTWTLRGPGQNESHIELAQLLCGDGHLARHWAVEGLGITLKSLFDVIDELEAGTLVQVLQNYHSQPLPIHTLFPSRRYLPARVRIVDEAVEHVLQARKMRCQAWLSQNLIQSMTS